MSASHAARDRRARVREWSSTAQRRVQDARKTSRGVDAAFVVQLRDRTVAGNLLASAIAYRVFLWLLPMSLLAAAALGFAQAHGRDDPARLAEDAGLGKSIVATVADAASQAEKSRYVLLVVALFGVYVAGAAGAKTLVAVHRLVWGLSPIGPRLGALASLAFTGSAFAILGVSLVANYIRSRSAGLGLGAAALIALLDAALWLGISLLLPHRTAPWPHLLPGALLIGVGMQAVHLASVYYLSQKIETASELYGGLGFSATVLLGLYILARLIVASAVLNATLWSRSSAGMTAGSLRAGEADGPDAVG